MHALPSLTALRVFSSAGRHLSFTQASKELHVTQGAVSRQIRQLEEHLGVTLFVRLHQKLELTAAGQQLLDTLESAFALMESTINEIRNPHQRQKLTILAPPTLTSRWLAQRIGDFKNRYPELELSIHNQANEWVRFDCEIRFGRTAKAKHYSELLFLEQHLPVCIPELLPRSHSLFQEEDNFLHILHEGRKLPVWEEWLTAADLAHQIKGHRGTEFSTLDQVIHSLMSGAGFAIIDKHMIVRELNAGTLIPFSQIEVTGPYGYWLDIPLNKQGLTKINFFTQWLKEQYTDP